MGYRAAGGRLQRVLGLDLPIADWAKEEGIADEEIGERITDAVGSQDGAEGGAATAPR